MCVKTINEDELAATHKAKVQEIHILDSCSKDIKKRTKGKENEEGRESQQLNAPRIAHQSLLTLCYYVSGGLKLCVNSLGL